MVEHEVAPANEAEIPVSSAGRNLVSSHSPIAFPSGGIAYQITSVLVIAERVITVAAEYRIQPPCVCLEIVCRNESSRFCLRVSRVYLQEIIVAGNQSERQGHAGHIYCLLFHNQMFYR